MQGKDLKHKKQNLRNLKPTFFSGVQKVYRFRLVLALALFLFCTLLPVPDILSPLASWKFEEDDPAEEFLPKLRLLWRAIILLLLATLVIHASISLFSSFMDKN